MDTLVEDRVGSLSHKVTVVESGRSQKAYWTEMWQYRELFYFFAWRDVVVRYKQTFLGIAWSLIRPAITMLVLTLVFGRIAKLPAYGGPYPIVVLAALLPWQLFSSALSSSSESIIGNSNLLSKVYFPRLIVPVSSVVVCLVDFACSISVLALVMLYFSFIPNITILAVPFLAVLAAALSLSFGIWLSALTVKYRDFRYLVPFLLQLGLYISPVGYTSDLVPAKWKNIYDLNPMVGIIEAFRWSILGQPAPGRSLVISTCATAVLLVSGSLYFRKIERTFVDVI